MGKSTSPGSKLAPRIYNEDGTLSFLFSKVGGTAAVAVGKLLPQGGKDTVIKVGDVVYLTISFSAKDPQDANDLNTSLNVTAKTMADFFKFYSPVDERALKVKILPDSVKIIPEVTPPVITIPPGNASFGNIVFECLLDLSDLVSGEKVIELKAFTEIGGITEETVIASSDAFYLHQSLSELMLTNIGNGGLGSLSTDSANLSRDRINHPTYFPVGLQPVNPLLTKDVALWEAIRNTTESLSFNKYLDFMDVIFCGKDLPINNESEFVEELAILRDRRRLPFTDTDAYRSIKIATEAFVMVNIANSGGDLGDYLETVADSKRSFPILPYLAIIRRKLGDIDFKTTSFADALDSFITPNTQRVADTCWGIISERIQYPSYLELIWSYWHEESMMVQGVNTITRRFQNIKGEGPVDPLANVEIGPLRPLSNILWGYIQDEQHRLTVRRRAYEYDHHYGITLQGKAVTNMRTVDSRSKFIEAFHMLLNLCIKFYRQYDDTTVVADGFPVMNALKEVHMILSEGAHNQFGDLPSTARIEMLMQQYLLARPEFREFLPTRQMVPYPEAWMDRAAVLNHLHGWTKTSVLHFRDLGVFGEQILLGIRFGAWSTVFNRDQAANWAIFWRPQIQNYIHAYRAVTGADLAREDNAPVDILQPSTHLVRKLKEQNGKVKL